MCLVEVVQVDDQVPFRRRVKSEVTQMSITANHRRDAGCGEMRYVLRHDDCGTPQETVRGGDHAANPDRNEMGNPAFVRADDQINGVWAPAARLPVSQRSTWHLVPKASTQLEPLGT
jgi:hypothetical protein